MKRGAWYERARELHASGLSYAEIGRELSVTRSAVAKALNPERAREWNRRANGLPGRSKAKRAWDRANPESHSDACPCCGGLKRRVSDRCEGCRRAVADVRRTLAEGMWADGWPHRDMAGPLGVRKFDSGKARLEYGWDLPYRYAGTKRQRVAS